MPINRSKTKLEHRFGDRISLTPSNFASAALAHEIRNPLTALATLVQLLPHKQGDPGFMASFQEIASREIGHLIHLTENYLDIQNVEITKKGIVDLEKVIRQVTELLTPLFGEKKVRLEVRLSKRPLFIGGDTHQMKSLASNLLKNALEAVQRQGQVEITLTPSGKNSGAWACLKVKDNGRGIPRNALGKVFKPYFSTQGRGRGLGLAICRKIVQNHGGRLEVRSSSRRGTEFSVLLPLVETPLKSSAKRGASKKHPRN